MEYHSYLYHDLECRQKFILLYMYTAVHIKVVEFYTQENLLCRVVVTYELRSFKTNEKLFVSWG